MSGRAALPFVWGATPQECAEHYTCDDFLPRAEHTFFRAIDVNAPVEVTYRWLQQLRIAPYSYDWLDNFCLPSPSRLTARADHIALGQRMMHVFSIVAFDTGHTLTLGPRASTAAALFGELYGTYVTTIRPAGGSRLFVKVKANYPRSLYGRAVGGLMPWIDLLMMRKQLLRLKTNAERTARHARAPQTR